MPGSLSKKFTLFSARLLAHQTPSLSLEGQARGMCVSVQRRRTGACVRCMLCLGDHEAAHLPPPLPLLSAWARQLSGARQPGSRGRGHGEGEPGVGKVCVRVCVLAGVINK